MKYCCEDFKIDVEGYEKITIKHNTIRFAGSCIYFCPFCGKKLIDYDTQKIVFDFNEVKK